MSIFGKIKDAIFGRKAQAQPAPGTPTVSPTGDAQAMPQMFGPSQVASANGEGLERRS